MDDWSAFTLVPNRVAGPRTENGAGALAPNARLQGPRGAPPGPRLPQPKRAKLPEANLFFTLRSSQTY
jgi:hypothetical protein